MDIQQVISHFDGIPATARALGVSYQAVREWKQQGRIPVTRRYQIEVVTKGKLKADS